MGHSVTPKYRFEFNEIDSRGREIKNTVVWEGRATLKRLEDWISTYVKSLKIGGCNEHLSKSLGYIPIPCTAWIVEQKTNRNVVEWRSPSFLCF